MNLNLRSRLYAAGGRALFYRKIGGLLEQAGRVVTRMLGLPRVTVKPEVILCQRMTSETNSHVAVNMC